MDHCDAGAERPNSPMRGLGRRVHLACRAAPGCCAFHQTPRAGWGVVATASCLLAHSPRRSPVAHRSSAILRRGRGATSLRSPRWTHGKEWWGRTPPSVRSLWRLPVDTRHSFGDHPDVGRADWSRTRSDCSLVFRARPNASRCQPAPTWVCRCRPSAHPSASVRVPGPSSCCQEAYGANRWRNTRGGWPPVEHWWSTNWIERIHASRHC